MSQPNGKGKGKADGPSAGTGSSQTAGASAGPSPSQPGNAGASSTSSSAKAQHATSSNLPGSTNNPGVRAGGIAAELGAMLRSSGKAVPGSSGTGSGGQLLADSALSDALQGAGGNARTGPALGPGAAFRRAAAPREGEASLSTAAPAGFHQEHAGTSRFADPTSPAAAVLGREAGIATQQQQQHPLLRPGAPLSPRLAVFSEALRGPWSTASDLDGELHAHARRESMISLTGANQGTTHQEGQQSSSWINEFSGGAAGFGPGVDEAAMEEAWRAHYQEGPGGVTEDNSAATMGDEQMRMMDPNFHAEWARTIPAPIFGGGQRGLDDQDALNSSALAGRVEEMDFFATLEADERAEEALSRQRGLPPAASGTTTDSVAFSAISQATDLAQLGIDASRLPPGITSEWRPPSPSAPPNVSIEQLLLHQALAAKQDANEADDADRARERIQPADDDEREQQGIFAATPEDALRTVWDGEGEAERVRRDKEKRLVDLATRIRRGEALAETERDVERLIADIKRWYPRGSYAEEVHGVPPLLAQTLADAELPAEETDPELVERRLAAIRRLEAMRTHLQSVRRP
ncbi:hypothetical protein A4X13_0g5896 [Tilletia indica]|uniref:Uncharacterized protein n=1 Tax=Tilletia indica TaxID=43049 RepID=A0A177TDV5_9BASI|nr:hypothetical protein A4X13_0g5896 [Tilletia indica]